MESLNWTFLKAACTHPRCVYVCVWYHEMLIIFTAHTLTLSRWQMKKCSCEIFSVARNRFLMFVKCFSLRPLIWLNKVADELIIANGNLQDRRSCTHSFLILCGGVGSREERRASELAVHVLDDRRNLRLSHGMGHHPTLWWVTATGHTNESLMWVANGTVESLFLLTDINEVLSMSP